MLKQQPESLACPICGARNLQTTTFNPPILFSDLIDNDQFTYICGTYYCTVCSKDGMITTKRSAPPIRGDSDG